MADGVDISRGNPRASSVGEDKNVEEIRHRSTLAIAQSDIVSIEDCGIPLDCSSGGGSFKPQDPCENVDLSIYNVMGQEDKFRQENGKRVERGGVARIVLTTVEETDVKLFYEASPPDENNPTFPQTEDEISTGFKYHEFFINVNPSSLYAFKVEIHPVNCPSKTNQSDIYYFSTGDTVTYILENFDAIPSTTVDTIGVEVMNLVDNFEGFFKEIVSPNTLDELSSSSSTEVITSTNQGSYSQEFSIMTTSFTTS